MRYSRTGRLRHRPTGGVKILFFLLLATFLLLAPASVSGGTVGGESILKWMRVAVLLCCFLLGLKWFRMPRMEDLSGKLLLLSIVFTAAAGWSTSPIWGFLFKGMFVCAVCASIALANCLGSETDFRALARTMTSAAVLGSCLVGYAIFIQGDYEIWHGRLIVAQMNANSLAVSASIFGLLCFFHLLIHDALVWKFVAVICIGVMIALIVYSGSRSAVLTLFAGIILLLPAIAKRQRHVMFLTVCSVIVMSGVSVVWIGYSEGPLEQSFSMDAEATDTLRIVDELTKDTRMRVWTTATKTWLAKSPVLGVGWIHRNNRWVMVQSSYLQVIVEVGVIGLILVVSFLYSGTLKVLKSLRIARRVRGFQSLMLYVFSATFFAIAFHGFFESAAVVGASPNAILLGFSAAQLDILVRQSVATPSRIPARSKASQAAVGST